MKFTSDEDEEDFKQEQLIKEWLRCENPSVEFDYKHITSKGTARNTRVRASISLDQKIGEDGSRTFADLIAGCDGRDLVCGGNDIEPERSIEEKIPGALSALGFSKELSVWVIKMLKQSTNLSKWRLEKFLTDSEW